MVEHIAAVVFFNGLFLGIILFVQLLKGTNE